MGSFSSREKVRMRGPRDKTRYLLSPHPSPLPEGEGIMLLLTASVVTDALRTPYNCSRSYKTRY